jgi:hypothetical protein
MLQNPYLPSGGIGAGFGPTAAPSPDISANISGPASKGPASRGGMFDTLTSTPANIGSLLGTVTGLALNSTPIGLGLSLAGRMIGGFGFGGPAGDGGEGSDADGPGIDSDAGTAGAPGVGTGNDPDDDAGDGGGSGGGAGAGDGDGGANAWHHGGLVADGDKMTYRNNTPIMAQEGEYIIPRDAVDYFGPDFFDMLRHEASPNSEYSLSDGERKTMAEQVSMRRALQGNVTNPHEPYTDRGKEYARTDKAKSMMEAMTR